MVNMRHLFIFLLGIIFLPTIFYLPFGGNLSYFRIFVPRLFVLHLFANGFVSQLSISHDSIVHQFFRSFFQFSFKTKKYLDEILRLKNGRRNLPRRKKIFLVCRS